MKIALWSRVVLSWISLGFGCLVSAVWVGLFTRLRRYLCTPGDYANILYVYVYVYVLQPLSSFAASVQSFIVHSGYLASSLYKACGRQADTVS